MTHSTQKPDVALTMKPMTPHELKNNVGVRELRDKLSRYVDHVAEGNEISITVRGKVVARMIAAAPREPFAELRRRGLLREPTRPFQGFEAPDEPLVKAGDRISDLVRDYP